MLLSFLLFTIMPVSLQNSGGGFATYELTRSYSWLEVVSSNSILYLTRSMDSVVKLFYLNIDYILRFLGQMINPAETFGDIVIDYP